jgi:hypothetical protein
VSGTAANRRAARRVLAGGQEAALVLKVPARRPQPAGRCLSPELAWYPHP